MNAIMFPLNIRRYIPKMPLPWGELVSPTVSLLNRVGSNFNIDARCKAIVEKRAAFVRASTCHVEEIIADDFRKPILDEIEEHRQRCVVLIGRKLSELHREKMALFARRHDAHAHHVAVSELQSAFKNLNFPPPPETRWHEYLTDENLRSLLGGQAGGVKEVEHQNTILDFDTQIASVEKERDVLSAGEWLGIAAVAFFNRSSISSGTCDAHGRVSTDPEIVAVCKELEITGADESHRNFWFKPSNAMNHGLFEKYVS